jgi:hypothetical protein
MATTDHERLEALQVKASKLAYQIDASVDRQGYCLWRLLPGVGRSMVLGREGGVTLDAIEKKLETIAKGPKEPDKIESEAGKKSNTR